MTVHQVATTLSISEQVVRRLLASGELEGIKVGREWRILRADLVHYLEQRSNTARTSR